MSVGGEERAEELAIERGCTCVGRVGREGGKEGEALERGDRRSDQRLEKIARLEGVRIPKNSANAENKRA